MPHSRTALSDVTLRGLSPKDQECVASYVKSEKAKLTEAEEGGGGQGLGAGARERRAKGHTSSCG